MLRQPSMTGSQPVLDLGVSVLQMMSENRWATVLTLHTRPRSPMSQPDKLGLPYPLIADVALQPHRQLQ